MRSSRPSVDNFIPGESSGESALSPQMLVEIARRSQILVNRLITRLDQLCLNEEDPSKRSELFALDHLATRLRRNDENLLVIAGAAASRSHQSTAELMEIFLAAQSEVEDYTRVRITPMAFEVSVSAKAVYDVVHLLAELLDNAISFSPPESTVDVSAGFTEDGLVIEVSDAGIGMSANRLGALNRRLQGDECEPPTSLGQTGLAVVDRLARRHQIDVELSASPGGGITARVILPVGLTSGW